jgi:hypothetical protein
MQQIDYSTVPGGISVKGNVAALTNLNGFTIATPYAIVYGGTIANDVSGGQEISNYLANTKLDWTVVKPQIQTLLDASKSSAVTAGALTSTTWYLNSPTADPNNTANATTFSTPPEGKLWTVGSGLSIPGAVEFKGSGTIIVNGNVTFNGPVTCSAGTRLGIVATGSITFKSSTIGCGSYVSMNDNINFLSTKTGKANGIFIAANSIVLPRMDDGELFEINYDTTFVSNPTIIFKELLKIINLTTIS